MSNSWQIPDLGGAPVASTENPFVHLHGHSIYSLRDAISNIYELIETAYKRGMNAIAVTDHGVMYGSFELYETAKLFNSGQKAKGLPEVKPIIGCELYECDDRTHPNGKADPNYHLPVLAYTSEGYSNLVQIVSDAATTGLIVRPGTGTTEETDINFIKANGLGKGLIALTGCLGSRIPQMLIGDYNDDGTLRTPPNPAEAARFLQKLKDTFDHVFIELQFHDHPLQQIANMALIELAARTKTPLVATRDYHYINKEDGQVHDVYVKCARGMDPYPGGHIYYLTSPEEMYAWLDNQPQLRAHAAQFGIDLYEALRNTQRIANAVDVHIPEAYAHFPAVNVPEGYTQRDYLRKLCFEELLEWAMTREIDVKTYIERLEYELQVIDRMGVVSYFLTLHRIINWCKKEADPPVPVGPGRGSGGGSLVLSLLGITEGDPIKDGLLFERFLNPERSGLPDVDIDISDDDRPRVIQFILDTWGADYVAQIGTHGSLSVKQATIDLIKTLVNPATGELFTQAEAHEITKPLPAKWPDQSDLTFDKLREVLNENPDPDIIGEIEDDEIESMRRVANDYFNAINQIPGLPEKISRVEGTKKSFGLHAGGIIISGIPIRTVCPVSQVPKSAILPATMYTMNQVAKLGLIKYDFLGLRTLRVIRLALENIEKTIGKKITFEDLTQLDRDDPEVWKPIGQGFTHGIFQFSGKAVTDVARRIRVKNYNEAVDCVSLARPGPMDAEVSPGKTMVDAYVEGGDPLNPPKPIHPSLEDILASTRQVVIYQEQVMAIVRRVAGYTFGGSDNVRRIISKKDIDAVRAISQEFIYGSVAAVPRIEAMIEEAKAKGVPTKSYEKTLKDIRERAEKNPVPGAINNGYDEEFAIHLMEALRAFAGYGFNRSHAARYVDIAFYTAWLKRYYPTEFMGALLTTEAGNPKKLPGNIAECRRLQLNLLGPDINRSELGFGMDVVDGKPAIRFGLLGIKGCGEGVVQEILAKRPYASFDDFLMKVDQRKIHKSIIQSLIKAGCFDSMEPNRYKLWNYFCFTVRKMLPEGTQTTKKSAEFAPQYDEAAWDQDARLEWENEALGIYVTGHPLDGLPYTRWNDIPDGKRNVTTSGVVKKIKEITTRKGDMMAFVTLETKENDIDLTLFPNTWLKYAPKLLVKDIIVVTGKRDKNSLIVDSLEVKGNAKGMRKPGRTAASTGGAAPKKSPRKTSKLAPQPDQFAMGLDLDLDLEPLPAEKPKENVKPDPLVDLFSTVI